MGKCCSQSEDEEAANARFTESIAPKALPPVHPPRDLHRSSEQRILSAADKYGPGACKLIADVLEQPYEPPALSPPPSSERVLSKSASITLKMELVATIAAGTEVSTELALLDTPCYTAFHDFLSRSEMKSFCPVLRLARELHRAATNRAQASVATLGKCMGEMSQDLLEIIWPERAATLSPSELAAQLLAEQPLAKLTKNKCVDVCDYECVRGFRASAEMRALSTKNRTMAYQLGNMFEKDLRLQAVLTGQLRKFWERVCPESNQLLFFVLDVLRVRRKASMPLVQHKLMQQLHSGYLAACSGSLWAHGFGVYLEHLPEDPSPVDVNQVYQAVLAHLQQNLFRGFLFSHEYCAYLQQQSSNAAIEHDLERCNLPGAAAEEAPTTRGSGWIAPTESDGLMLG